MLDTGLYLPKDWAEDAVRRAQTHVPEDVAFAEKWRLGLALLDAARGVVPGQWVVGDDEFGRCSELRQALRARRLKYVLDVPCNTLVRDPSERLPPRRPGGRPRLPAFERVDHWVARQPAGRWRTVVKGDGAKGPLTVSVLVALVQTKEEDGRLGGRERVVVRRTHEAVPRTWYALSNDRDAGRAVLARVHGGRHGIEELLEEGNQEVGLGHYEVRSWVGWSHPMTWSLLALWFLQVERRRLGEKTPGGDGVASAVDRHGVAAGAGCERGADRGGSEPGTAA